MNVILLAVEAVDDAMRVALSRAQSLCVPAESELHVLLVCEPGSDLVTLFNAEAELRRELRSVLADTQRLCVRGGEFLPEVCTVAARIGAQVIVVPSSAGAPMRAARLARHSRVPVLVARPAVSKGPVVGATDLLRARFPVIQHAGEMATRLSARAVLVHSVNEEPHVLARAEALRSAARDHAPAAETVVTRHEEPLHAILAAERIYGSDVTVVGTTLMVRPDVVAPSLAEDVVRLATRSVLVTPVE